MNTQNKYDGFFAELKNTSPYLKVAAEGAAGSGKTYTLALITAGLYARIKSTKPIVIFDTERAAKFLRPFFASRNIPVLLKESRTLSDVASTIAYCDAGNADILIIDSITHVWEGFLTAFQEQKKRTRLEFQDWGIIKPAWRREFSDRLVMAKCHIMFTGREGFVYESEINPDTQKREIFKVGVKMKVEGDTAYEPDVLLRMERFEEVLDKEHKKVWREATVIKDRSALIDGKTFVNPGYEDFEPVVAFLLADVAAPTEIKTTGDAPLIGDEEERSENRKDCQIQLERINALLDSVAAGTGKAEKSLRLALTKYAFYGETSESAIARMEIGQLDEAHVKLLPMVAAVAAVLKGESIVWPKEADRDKQRMFFLETTNLGDATVENLSLYTENMREVLKSTRKLGQEKTA
jgi:hypothetical protein